MDEFGKPRWIDLSKEVGAWATAAGKEEPPEIEWKLPSVAETRSSNAKFVDAMLGLEAGVGSPADKLLLLMNWTHFSLAPKLSVRHFVKRCSQCLTV